MFRELDGGCGLCGGPGKKVNGVLFMDDDLRAFGITDQWTTAAHDEGERRRTAERAAEHFMTK